jgi:hypothetical protein
MNSREFKCVDTLTDLIENEGLIGIKTSFEDEGALFNETVRLKQVCNQANTKITLKIGGPEAIRDIKDALIIGVKGLVAPMVESAFGLQKFIQAAKTYIPPDAINSIQLGINIETQTSVNDIDKILCANDIGALHGLTVGRVDLAASLGQSRDFVNSDQMYTYCKNVLSQAKSKNLKLCVGGAISTDSATFLKKLHSEGFLDKFETRYAIFDPSIALKNLGRALYKGQLFEYEWLKCKHEYYMNLANQDIKRIQMIQDRINQSVSDI